MLQAPMFDGLPFYVGALAQDVGGAAEHRTFDWMKANASKVAPLGGMPWDGGADTFINKGVNGRWRDVLSAEESARYEALALENLGPECAAWLASGKGG